MAKTKGPKIKKSNPWQPRLATLVWWLALLFVLAVYISDLLALGDPQTALALLSDQFNFGPVVANLPALGWSPSLFLALFLLPEVLSAAGFVVVGVLIRLRGPKDWFSWFSSLWMLVFGLVSTSTFTGGSLQDSPLIAVFYISVLFAYLGIVIFMITYPDGVFHPAWGRWLVLGWGVFISGTVVFGDYFSWDSPVAAAAIVTILSLVLYSQIYRYRKVSTPAQREQTKWLIAAIAANVVLIIVTSLLRSAADSNAGTPGAVTELIVSNWANYGANLLLVTAVGIAILRYRLWDIDVVVNRALIYGPLSVILAGIFAASVALINQATRELLGAEAAGPAAAASALIVATVFQPLRNGIESWINRRVYSDNSKLARELVEISDPRFALGKQALAKLVAERVSAVMGSTAGAVYFADGAGFKLAAASKTARVPATLRPDAKTRAALAAGRTVTGGPLHLLAPLYVPRLRSKQLVGLLAIGLRQQERGYSSDDRAALAELGGQVGTALYAAELR
jgi:hypothetical protein